MEGKVCNLVDGAKAKAGFRSSAVLRRVDVWLDAVLNGCWKAKQFYRVERWGGLVFWRPAIYKVSMKNDVVPVQIRGILPANSGCALFVGNDDKAFVINVEPN